MKPTYGERALELTVAVVVENSGLENTFLNPEWKARCWAGVFQFPSWLQVPYLLRFYSKTKAILTRNNFRPPLWKLKASERVLLLVIKSYRLHNSCLHPGFAGLCNFRYNLTSSLRCWIYIRGFKDLF